MATRSRTGPVRSRRQKRNPTPKQLNLEQMSELVASLRGCCKGEDSSVDALHQERQEKSFAERRWEK